MKERPILFKGEMVCAILAGRKTQTRRVCRFTAGAGYLKEPNGHRRWHRDDPEAVLACPYGVPGDRLYVKETWRPSWHDDIRACVEYRADGAKIKPTITDEGIGFHFFGECDASEPTDRWRPSIHMPRWASRLTLEIVSARVERLCVISERDAVAEGCMPDRGIGGQVVRPGPREAFENGWDRINGKRAPWASNPWVWVVGFRRIKA